VHRLAGDRWQTRQNPRTFVHCEYAWNKDPVFGVIGIQSGPRG
jgi:hypothetical protein